MEYSTHKPVPVHEMEQIIEKFSKAKEETKVDKKKGSSFDI
jgi:hypothetical protein